VANHKSAVKRNKQSQERRNRNRANRTMVKGVVKAVDTAITEASSEKAQQ
jgi:small subunit ribosomal protein S20